MLRSERIRIDTGVLFPELVNNDVRLDPDGDMLWWHFPEGISMMCVMTANAIANYNRWLRLREPEWGRTMIWLHSVRII